MQGKKILRKKNFQKAQDTEKEKNSLLHFCQQIVQKILCFFKKKVEKSGAQQALPVGLTSSPGVLVFCQEFKSAESSKNEL